MSNAQIEQVLTTQQLSPALQQQALLEAGLLKSKKNLSNAEIEETLQTVLGADADTQAVISSMELKTTTDLTGKSVAKLTQKNLLAAVSTGKLSKEQAVELANLWGIKFATDANVKSSLPKWIAGLKLSAKAIWENITATATWLATNPIGWIAASCVAIGGLIAYNIKLDKSVDSIREKASELSDEFSDAKNDLSDYKTKVEDLYSTINDSTASINEVTDAREQLFSIQNELISKYGTEEESIRLVTDAINGQSDAWDKLSAKKWQETKNKFNDNSDNKSKDAANRRDGYSDNIDRMVNEYGNYSIDLNFGEISGRVKRAQAKNLLKEFGEFGELSKNGVGFIKLEGNATQVYEKLLKIQSLVKSSDFNFGKDFENRVDTLVNNAKAVSDQYESMYQQYVLYDKILTNNAQNYSVYFTNIQKAYDKYSNAKKSGDEETIQKESDNFASTVDSGIKEALENGDEDVAEYFRKMYPELQNIVSKWEFNIKFEADTDGIKNKVNYDLTRLTNGNNGKAYTTEELLSLKNDNSSLNEAQKDAYRNLEAIASNYHMSIQELIQYLEEQNLVFSDKYVELTKEFGEDNVKTLTSDQLKTAYTIDLSTISSWDELKDKIEEVKKATKEASDATKKFKTLNDSYNTLEDNASLLNTINTQIKETGRLSSENLSKISEAFSSEDYPEMTKALYDYRRGMIEATDVFDVLQECYEKDTKAYAEKLAENLSDSVDFYNSVLEYENDNITKLGEAYSKDFKNWTTLEEAKRQSEAELIATLTDYWKDYYNIIFNDDGYAELKSKKNMTADDDMYSAAYEDERVNMMDKINSFNKLHEEMSSAAKSVAEKMVPGSYEDYLTDTSKSSSKDSTDAWKEEAEKQIKLLDHYHDMGYLSDEQYYKALNELNEKYYAGQEKYLDDYRSYAEKIYSGLKQAYSDMLNKQKDYMGQAINAVTGYLDDQIDALNDQKDAVEDEYNARIEALESEQDLLDKQKDAIEEQKNAIQEQIDAIDKANEARQKAIDLQKKQYELNRAMNQNTNKVYVNGQMVWQTDDSAITDARNDLEDAKAQDATDKLQDQIDELDKASDALDKQKDALQAQIDSLNDELDKITEGIEKQIDELQKYKDRWAEIPDQFTYVQNQMIASMMLGQDWQQKALSMNEDMLYTFGTSYNNIQGQLQLVTDASAQDIVNMAQLSGEQLGILAAQADESLTEMGGSIQGQSEISEEALNQLMLAGTDSLSTLASKVGESSQSVCTSIGDIITKAAEAITTLNQLSELQDKMDFAPIYSGVTVTAMRNGGVVEVETARKGTVTGSHRSKIAKSLGEDHLVVAREGEGFVPPEQVKDVQDSVKAVNKFADLLIPAESKFKFDNFDVEQTVMSSNLIKQPGLDFSGVNNTTSQNNTIKIESGAIVLNEVTKPDVVGEAIIKELPNYVTRKLNQR